MITEQPVEIEIKEREDSIKRMADLLTKVVMSKEGGMKIAAILELREQRDYNQREVDRLGAEVRTREMQLVSEFNLTHAEWMNMSIALRWDGLKKIIETNKVERYVV